MVSEKTGIVNLGGSFYICGLCSTGRMCKNSLQKHVAGYRHKKRIDVLRMGDRRNQVRSLPEQVSKLYGPWKNRVKVLLYEFVVCGHMSCLHQAKLAFKHYELLECISLLELAVWKVSCLRLDDMGASNFTTMQGIMDLWAVDNSFDPNEFKRQRRYAGNLATIMRHVVPFLKPSET